MRSIPLTDAEAPTVTGWLEKAGYKLGPGMRMLVGEPGDPRGFASISFEGRFIFVDALCGTKSGCKYILQICEEFAVSRAAFLAATPISDGAVEAAHSEGYHPTDPAILWTRIPYGPKPKQAVAEPPQEADGTEQSQEPKKRRRRRRKR